jgi:hypothetical protein
MSSDKKTNLSSRLAKKAIGRIYTSIEETVVPRTEDFIFDLFSSVVNGFSNLVIGAFEGLIYRDEDYDYSSSRKDRNYGRSSYHDYYDRKRNSRKREPSVVRKKDNKRDRSDAEGYTLGLISCDNWDSIYYDNKRTADRLLKRIQADAVSFDGLTVAALYELLKKTGGEFTDTYYGWKNLDRARVQAVGPREYWLRLPDPVDID